MAEHSEPTQVPMNLKLAQATSVVSDRGNEDVANTEKASKGSFSTSGKLPAVGGFVENPAKTASERAYDGVDPTHERNDRSRSTLGPEDPSNFAKPYESSVQALAAETFLRTTLLPALLGKFGPEVTSLWAAYLSRNPGDSLEPRLFEDKGSIVDAFRNSYEIRLAQRALLYELESNLRRRWAVTDLPQGTWTDFPLEARYLKTNFNMLHTIPGNIAGGAGSSAAGPDWRRVSGSYQLLKTSPWRILLRANFRFEIFDAIDFIPGGMGSDIETIFTIPLSRLEASGWAFDVPFQVNFTGPPEEREVVRGLTGEKWDARKGDQRLHDKARRNPPLLQEPIKKPEQDPYIEEDLQWQQQQEPQAEVPHE